MYAEKLSFYTMENVVYIDSVAQWNCVAINYGTGVQKVFIGIIDNI